MAGPIRLNNSMLEELKQSFQFRDYDQDGEISAEDIPAVVRSVKGLMPSDHEIREMISQVKETSDNGCLKLDTCVQLVSRYCTSPEPATPREIMDIFSVYERDKKGYISVQDMIHILTSVGEKLSEKEAEDLIKHSDAQEGGLVNCKKFVERVMTG